MKTTELYAFVGWVGSIALYIVYLLWAFVPDNIWHSIGIYYYPDRSWALALPSMFCMTAVFIFSLFQALNFTVTKELSSFHLMQDEKSKPYEKIDENDIDAIPEIHDLPITVVNNILYSGKNSSQKCQNNKNTKQN